jgi:hypothetical protein
MARRKNEAIAVGPQRRGGIEIKSLLPQAVRRPEPYPSARAWVPGLGFLDRIDGEGADRIDRQPIELDGIPMRPRFLPFNCIPGVNPRALKQMSGPTSYRGRVGHDLLFPSQPITPVNAITAKMTRPMSCTVGISRWRGPSCDHARFHLEIGAKESARHEFVR